MTLCARKHAARAAFSGAMPCVMPYRNAPASMSPAPVRSFGSLGNAGDVGFDAGMPEEDAVRAVRDDQRRDRALELGERFLGGFGLGATAQASAFVAEEQVGLRRALRGRRRRRRAAMNASEQVTAILVPCFLASWIAARIAVWPVSGLAKT